MTERLRLFVLAGEHSGDRLAADLVRRLRARVDLSLEGIGGEELAAQGLRSRFPMSDLSVMGFWDVAARLPRLLLRVRQTAGAILRARPDIVVLVDAQVFSRLVAKRLRGAGYRAPILLYVSPSVWGRSPERARKIKPLFDEVLAILPFEPGVMARLGGPPTRYVGHPALAEAQPAHTGEGHRVALLPGSRHGELRRHLPLLRAVAEALPEAGTYFIPTLPALAPALSEAVRTWAVPVEVVADRAERAKLYGESLCAVSVAGTATLELALAGVPTIVTYWMDRPQARTFELLGHPRVSLPNIVLGRDLLPEIILSRPDSSRLIDAVRSLLADASARAEQRAGFAAIAAEMTTGLPDWPREDPADRVLAHFRKHAPTLAA